VPLEATVSGLVGFGSGRRKVYGMHSIPSGRHTGGVLPTPSLRSDVVESTLNLHSRLKKPSKAYHRPIIEDVKSIIRLLSINQGRATHLEAGHIFQRVG
jgi:hypothetical protein